jgi:GDPmannose 4,6-dehydratase
MQKAVVLGVNGQDGSYLAESLLSRGYDVIGIGRQERSRYVKASKHFHYTPLDLEDVGALERLLAEADPDVAFHFAAIHGSSGFVYEPVWRSMMTVNVLTLHALLEHARTRRPDMRVVYASSAKLFPSPWKGIIDEATPRRATCLYGIGKLASLDLIARYRDKHHIAASNLYLFNHESVRRGREFFVPTIARCLAAAIHDRTAAISVESLNFRADWSSAAELMDIAIDIAEKAPNDDFVLASGKTWHAREAVDALFRGHGLNYRDHIRELAPDRELGPEFRVSLARLQAMIARQPVASLFAIVDEMVELAATPALPVAASVP